MSVISRFYGPNAGYVLELYDRYRQDPASVDPETRALFERWTPEAPTPHANGAAPGATAIPAVDVAKIVALTRLAESIRERGHRAAHTDPLGSEPAGDPSLQASEHGLSQADLEQLPASIVGGPVANGAASAAVAIERLRAIYCGAIGYDFAHVQSSEQRAWLTEAVESGRYQTPLSAEMKRAVLQRLTDVEAFERFLHRVFVGRKRFSIEGTDMMVPMIDTMVDAAVGVGTKDVIIGMAHRGRLNVLAHIMGKPYAKFFAEFMGLDHGSTESDGDSDIATSGWTGDVKYHLGAYRPAGEIPTSITMACNPSHLEYVNPVVAGMTRAAQEKRDEPGEPRQDVDSCLAILLHGDAAFPGEGIVAESLNLSRLPEYQVGGILHIIANNQIGFTTEPWQSRSTFYASDLARGFEIPIVHVDGDNPEACLAVTRMACDFREAFHEEFLIDLIGYRRW
ncbi:MAG TPA: thiamine pyrophosphate-dependent enzyme, partial [Thermomicrobiaceae bacterium]|nr:thiamine pyrophosphate-dependent enzyme [Thermomicrobiaceae bacterium]